MGVRPPPDDTDDEPETIAFGIAALDARLTDNPVEFPADADELVRALGDPKVPYDATGNAMPLSAALDQTHRTRFESERELLNALHPVFEAQRERASNSILAQLKGLLPF